MQPLLKKGAEKVEIFQINQTITIVNTLSYRTISAKKEEVQRDWYLVDATGLTAGRLFTRIATVLRGKHKPSYTPHVDTGDFVIVVNAEKIRFTGKKLDQKEYQRYSGYPGGRKLETVRSLLNRRPTEVITRGVKGMLPKTKLGRAMHKKLFVYEGPEHPHFAQKPQPFNF